ncbi:hypothetical protein BZA05DRAFT_15954 [Tricharina praecox]|uniref:uncharacterized protein n=1 Tax=Tricharina praecox TaxID=43433 RepID=UPI002220ADD8|nr:uncharacterized protein BZA05DRAFT_15954 [Tricharina praecox]KAI5858854.1 hypothetical protein BZA05DRAFT_15954 [Tricharina praecox]
MLRTTASRSLRPLRPLAYQYSYSTRPTTTTANANADRLNPKSAAAAPSTRAEDVSTSQVSAHLGRAQSQSHTSQPVTQSERDDAVLMAKLEEMVAGDGGASGVEYEDGNPADMKRAVRSNMFRVI